MPDGDASVDCDVIQAFLNRPGTFENIRHIQLVRTLFKFFYPDICPSNNGRGLEAENWIDIIELFGRNGTGLQNDEQNAFRVVS